MAMGFEVSRDLEYANDEIEFESKQALPVR